MQNPRAQYGPRSRHLRAPPPGHRRALALPLPVLSDPPTLGHEVDSSGLTQTEEVGDLYMFQSGPRPRSIYMCKHLGFTSVYSETPVNLDLDLRLHIVCTNCFDSVTPYNVRKKPVKLLEGHGGGCDPTTLELATMFQRGQKGARCERKTNGKSTSIELQNFHSSRHR